MALKSKLIQNISENVVKQSRKITVVGCGAVGMAVVVSIIGKALTTELCLIDPQINKIKGEVMDIQHGAALINNAKLTASADFKASEGSEICIINAGLGRPAKNDRLELLKDNIKIVQDCVEKLVKYNPCSKILMVTNPVDVLSYVAWKTSGFPVNRIIGSGTSLDSNRFRCFIAERLCVSPATVYASIIGEHGKSAVPCWSGVTVGNAHLKTMYPDFGNTKDPDKWFELHDMVKNAAFNVINLKGVSAWGVGITTAYLARCILDNTYDVTPVSTNAKGFHGINEDVFLSLPCVLGLNGVQGVLKQNLTAEEKQALENSAKLLLEHQRKCGVC